VFGRWLAGRRPDVIVATKACGPMSRRRWDRGNSRKHLIEACEASLRRLDTDYIDLHQLHADDMATPLEETIRALDDLVTSGMSATSASANGPPGAWPEASACPRPSVGSGSYEFKLTEAVR